MTGPLTYTITKEPPLEFLFTAYLLRQWPNQCRCGHSWTHSELFEVWLPNQPEGEHRSKLRDLRPAKLDSAGCLRQGPIGTATLPPKMTIVCTNCVTAAQIPRSATLEPISKEAWLAVVARKSIPEVADKLPKAQPRVSKTHIPTPDELI
jgi:hypothetical protein